MRKSLFFAVILAVAMGSCTNDEVVEVNNGNAIGFRTAVGTRATEMTNSNFEKMYVSAYADGNLYFGDVEFKKEGTGESALQFTSGSVKYYWPSSGDLTFVAYSPSMDEIGGSLKSSSKGLVVENFSPSASVEGQVDFITATATGSKADNENKGVELEFGHNLSQIVIQAKNTNSAYKYQIRGVRIANVSGTANFDGFSDSWSSLSDKNTSYTITYSADHAVVLDGSKSDASSLMNTSGSAMIIPQSVTGYEKSTNADGTYIAVLINLKTAAGYQIFPVTDDMYGWVAVKLDQDFDAGKKYVITLDFSTGAGFVAPDQSAGEGDKENGYKNDNEDDNNTPADPSDDDPIADNIDPKLTGDDPEIKPGDNILGSAIKFTVTVTGWEETSKDI